MTLGVLTSPAGRAGLGLVRQFRADGGNTIRGGQPSSKPVGIHSGRPDLSPRRRLCGSPDEHGRQIDLCRRGDRVTGLLGQLFRPDRRIGPGCRFTRERAADDLAAT
jgi:hypothetical protein